MAWSTIRETLIRQFCIPVRGDATNWPDATLQSYWDQAHTDLTTVLCPPFSLADLNALNHADTHSPSGNLLIARYAALSIYRALTGQDEHVANLEAYFYGGGQFATAGNQGYFNYLIAGSATLFDSAGNAIARGTNKLHHNMTGVARVFTETKFDTSGNQIGVSGTLEQFKNG